MTLILGDCIDVMAAMEPESVDAVVTDPPYGIGFMGKAWDRAHIEVAARKDAERRKSLGPHSASKPGRVAPRSSSAFGNAAGIAGSYRFDLSGSRAFQAWCEPWARECLRVAKPGAYLLAFGGTRTYHRMVCAIEDAGWEIRDSILWGSWLGGWVHAQGFPKSKSSLKPAWEPIVLARKPGPLRELAIDACRIGTTKDVPASVSRHKSEVIYGGFPNPEDPTRDGGHNPNLGRWPANVILTADENGRAIFDGDVPGVVGGGEARSSGEYVKGSVGFSPETGTRGVAPFGVDGLTAPAYGDAGTYSRFFLVPKSARAEREPVLGGLPLSDDPFAGTAHSAWCERCRRQRVNVPGAACACDDPIWTTRAQRQRANHHPTVKPLDLMRHLVRLVTPPGGTVLDMFAGSGTTLLAAEMEGFRWIGVEKEAEYVAIAEARLNGTQRGLGLPA